MTASTKDILVTTDWLAAHLSDADLRVFDCTGSVGPDFINRGRERHYDVHHIVGAAYLDVGSPKGEMSNPDGVFPFTWPTEAQFEATMSRLGVANNSRVVLYAGPNPDAHGGNNVGTTWATRAWWLMHHFGIDCAMLDGGWQKWVRENRPVSSKASVYPPTSFKAGSNWRRGLAMKEDVLRAANTGSACIVDSLSPASYRGETDKQYGSFGNRKGHIKNAVNAYFESMTDPATGCFLAPDLLRQQFAVGGVKTEGPVITYCGGGIGATMTGFALKLIGHDDVAIYDASMMEWNANTELPMTDPSAAVSA